MKETKPAIPGHRNGPLHTTAGSPAWLDRSNIAMGRSLGCGGGERTGKAPSSTAKPRGAGRARGLRSMGELVNSHRHEQTEARVNPDCIASVRRIALYTYQAAVLRSNAMIVESDKSFPRLNQTPFKFPGRCSLGTPLERVPLFAGQGKCKSCNCPGYMPDKPSYCKCGHHFSQHA